MFDIAYKGVMGQGHQSSQRGSCLYNDPLGGKCAAGHIFAVTHPGFVPKEHQNVTAVLIDCGSIKRTTIGLSGRPPAVVFAENLQSIHDEWGDGYENNGDDFLTYYKRRMSNFAFDQYLVCED
jgi:hypothetical protein